MASTNYRRATSANNLYSIEPNFEIRIKNVQLIILIIAILTLWELFRIGLFIYFGILNSKISNRSNIEQFYLIIDFILAILNAFNITLIFFSLYRWWAKELSKEIDIPLRKFNLLLAVLLLAFDLVVLGIDIIVSTTPGNRESAEDIIADICVLCASISNLGLYYFIFYIQRENLMH